MNYKPINPDPKHTPNFIIMAIRLKQNGLEYYPIMILNQS